jgi:hypothetical protein
LGCFYRALDGKSLVQSECISLLKECDADSVVDDSSNELTKDASGFAVGATILAKIALTTDVA